MSDFIIKIASPSDSETIAALGRRTFLAAHENSTPKEDMEAYLDAKFNAETVAKELNNNNNVFHLVYAGEKVAGYSKIIYNTPTSLLPESSNICKMERLYIAREFYDKKLGYKLFNFNKDLCIRNNQSGMWLTVWVENERAIAFYDRMGFKIIGEILFTVGKQESPNYVMWLEF